MCTFLKQRVSIKPKLNKKKEEKRRGIRYNKLWCSRNENFRQRVYTIFNEIDGNENTRYAANECGRH